MSLSLKLGTFRRTTVVTFFLQVACASVTYTNNARGFTVAQACKAKPWRFLQLQQPVDVFDRSRG